MGGPETPFFRQHVFCCTNRREEGNPRGSCAQKGSEKLRDYLKKKIKMAGVPETRINTAGCLDRCEHGPVMVIYPEGVWYTYQDERDINEILETHLVGGEKVERLLLSNRDVAVL